MDAYLSMRFFIYLYDLHGFSDFFFKKKIIHFMFFKAKEGQNLFDYYTKK
jgi:hypothetical protein